MGKKRGGAREQGNSETRRPKSRSVAGRRYFWRSVEQLAVVEGAKVDASVVKNGKGKKILVFKYKPKKGYRKRQGHRQPYTKVTIGAISM